VNVIIDTKINRPYASFDPYRYRENYMEASMSIHDAKDNRYKLDRGNG
jgi:hypothetical protein